MNPEILTYAYLMIGVYFIVIGILANCRELVSKLFIKAIPMIIGIFMVEHSLSTLLN